MVLSNPSVRAFLMVVEMGTVHAAAGRLFITQTAVTQRIKSLERRLEVDLFIRSKKGMKLTSAGETFLHYANMVVNLSAESESQIRGEGTLHSVPVCITAATTLMHARVMPAMLKVMKAFPCLQLQFDVDDSMHLVHKLKTYQSDFIITEPNYIPEGFGIKKLQPDDYVLVAPKSWARRKLQEIVNNELIIDFSPEDQMTLNYLKQFGLFELVKRERVFANRTELLAELVASGLGYSVLTTHFVKRCLAASTISVLNHGQCYQQQLVLAWNSRPLMPDYMKSIVSILG